jgi:hypothetical protein
LTPILFLVYSYYIGKMANKKIVEILKWWGYRVVHLGILVLALFIVDLIPALTYIIFFIVSPFALYIIIRNRYDMDFIKRNALRIRIFYIVWFIIAMYCMKNGDKVVAYTDKLILGGYVYTPKNALPGTYIWTNNAPVMNSGIKNLIDYALIIPSIITFIIIIMGIVEMLKDRPKAATVENVN